ncbi:MAG: ADP-ribosylglycohydrolase family protein [Magnetococcales bacterium]|nr:ADP-ribosylglycohydrolase family protein [Magnetococcales bacterium]
MGETDRGKGDSAGLSAAITGSLLGLAVGDAMGLPWEGISRGRQTRFKPDHDGYRFLFGKGFCSDDTEHACMTAMALIRSQGEGDRFSRSLGWRLRFWLMGLPAGVGMATGKAIIKLWLGFSPVKSGVFSAGNGPAMRAPILGVAYGENIDTLRDLVRRSTRVTHTDPLAEQGALAVALAAAMAFRSGGSVSGEDYLAQLTGVLRGSGADTFLEAVRGAVESAGRGEAPHHFAKSLGCDKGVSGYILHTVPVVLQIWLRFPGDYPRGIREIIALGGDTDTTAAILGGILGAGVGEEGIPEKWLDEVWEWPRSVVWMRGVARVLAGRLVGREERFPSSGGFLFLPLRNFLFFIVVLLHGFRRLLPPW